jgi:fatty aldehyde-generating acyl-ACP reductase
MKFATIGHFLDTETINMFPKDWVKGNLIVSPEMNINGARGYITGVTLNAKQIMNLPVDIVRKTILDAALYLQDELDVNLIQLGALTTSVTSGGQWVVEQKEYKGFVNHGDSYTAAVTCQVVKKALKMLHRNPTDQTISIVGAYGIIGEAVSKILVPQFAHSILIGRREDKLVELKKKLNGDFEITVDLKTKDADIIITATSHPTDLLNSEHIRKDAIIIDVSLPPNLTIDVCQKRPDIYRIDGGYVDFPTKTLIPGMPIGKNFACIVEVIMQTIENEKKNHVGSIELNHLIKTEKWGEKYGFKLNELTNFGKPINQI